MFYLFDARRYLVYKEYRFESWCFSLFAFYDDDLLFRRYFVVFFTLILFGDLSLERW